MTYLPRPEPERTNQDVTEIYALAAEELQRAEDAEERRRAFRHALLRAYEAGVDAQRELINSYVHDRPTPVPPAPVRDDDDPGTLPKDSHARSVSPRAFPPFGHPHEPKKR